MTDPIHSTDADPLASSPSGPSLPLPQVAPVAARVRRGLGPRPVSIGGRAGVRYLDRGGSVRFPIIPIPWI
jgi:hypothetical protein